MYLLICLLFIHLYFLFIGGGGDLDLQGQILLENPIYVILHFPLT